RELGADVHAAEQERQHVEPVGLHEVADQKDEATQSQMAESDSAQEQLERDELAEVDAALRRLDDGTYGDCAGCGNSIPLQRLMVQPAALRCAACQAAYECNRELRPPH
ncbi:MAG TPA: TraR/DksA family transcriptional regulator, partial [Methylibium sp.]